MAKAVNYTEEQTASLIEAYVKGQTAGMSNKDNVAAIAENLGRATRSVSSKLSREGVYVTEVKAKAAPRDEGPSKAELLTALEDAIGISVESAMALKKSDIEAFTAAVVALKAPVAEEA